MESFSDFASAADSFIWSPYLLIPALIGTGIILTIRLGAIHLLKLGAALRLGLFNHDEDSAEGDITNYQALSTALAATVGVGNIVGVATAIGLGRRTVLDVGHRRAGYGVEVQRSLPRCEVSPARCRW